jgi:hypothetical protein
MSVHPSSKSLGIEFYVHLYHTIVADDRIGRVLGILLDDFPADRNLDSNHAGERPSRTQSGQCALS